MLLVQEEGHGQVANLLLGVLVGGDEVDRFEMSKVDIPAENVDVQKLWSTVSKRVAIVHRLVPVAPCKHISFCDIH